MSLEQYCISWDSYKSNMTKGFSSLQQNAEFVDMTLAADGYFVKVHQNIIALASPYLKQILKSAPCQHPIIFLSNVNHSVLGYLLEYMYTGEVKITTDAIHLFIDACKALKISGVENFILPKVPVKPNEPLREISTQPPDTNYAACITINAQDFNLEVKTNDNNIAHENLPQIIVDNSGMDIDTEGCVPSNYNYEINPTNSIDDINNINTQNEPLNKIGGSTIKYPTILLDKQKPIHTGVKPVSQSSVHINETNSKDAVLYSVSNRGSVQLILNQCIYYCHHNSLAGRKRRWRCIDYRRIHCPASVDTYQGNITHRNESHNHRSHSNKVLKKVRQKAVFNSMSCVEEKIMDLNIEKKLSNEEEQDEDTINTYTSRINFSSRRRFPNPKQ